MLRPRPILTTLTIAVLSATLVLAALPPFDFTGTWTGAATDHRGDSLGMSADLTSTGPKTFTGSMTLETIATCSVDGVYGKRVKLHLLCGGQRRTLRVHLDSNANTLSGHFALGKQRVKFTLTKNG